MYVWPGSDNSTDHKIAIDMKFEAKDTSVRYKPAWQEYKKTALACFGGRWSEVQYNVPLEQSYQFAMTPEKCAILIHPVQNHSDANERIAF